MESPAAKKKLSEQERERILEQARRELPELDYRYKRAVAKLGRISRGERSQA